MPDRENSAITSGKTTASEARCTANRPGSEGDSGVGLSLGRGTGTGLSGPPVWPASAPVRKRSFVIRGGISLLVLPAGARASWEPIESIDVFDTACWIEVPPIGWTDGLGPYWLHEPGSGRLTTPVPWVSPNVVQVWIPGTIGALQGATDGWWAAQSGEMSGGVCLVRGTLRRCQRSGSSRSPSTAQNLFASLASGARCWGTSHHRHRWGTPPGTTSTTLFLLRSGLMVRLQRSVRVAAPVLPAGSRREERQEPRASRRPSGHRARGRRAPRGARSRVRTTGRAGATDVRTLYADEENESCIPMLDIEGNEFCLD